MSASRPLVIQLLRSFNVEVQGGGADRFGMELARNLDGSLFDRVVWALWDFGAPDERHNRDRLERAGIATLAGPSWNESSPYRGWWEAYSFYKANLPNRPAVIVNTHSEFADPLAMVLKIHRPGLRIVRSVHIPHAVEWPRKPGRRLVLTNFLFPLIFDREIGVAPQITDRLNARWLPRRRRSNAVYLPNSIDLARFSSSPLDPVPVRKKFSIPADAFLVGAIGRMVEYKGFQDLIDAAELVIQQAPNVYFLLVGDGPLLPEIRGRAAESGRNDRIIFAGAQPQIESIYRAFDLFVSPSHAEGLPTVIMESLAAGIPVVATDIPGSREIIRDQLNGWMSPAGAPQALAQTILAAVNRSDLRQAFAAKGKTDALNYSIESVARQYAGLYLSLFKHDTPAVSM